MGHLTESQRYTIEVMYKSGHKQKEIALTIDKDKSVISREISRNRDQRSRRYISDLAQRKYNSRQKHKGKRILLNEKMIDYIEDKLKLKYSPEQIVGLAKKEGRALVSHERIYQHIWLDKKLGGNLYTHLRTQGKRYCHRGASKDKRGQIIGRVDINDRPKIVEKKERLGDLEIDTIIGKNHQGAIVTINDRASGKLKMHKLSSKNADQLAETTTRLLKPYKKYLKTITSDNGKEFASHKKIAESLNIKFYFAHPYHSWERGANENLNGLIRQYIPKQTDFSTITNNFVRYVEKELNKRPRKRHNYRTPNAIFNQLMKNEKVALVT